MILRFGSMFTALALVIAMVAISAAGNPGEGTAKGKLKVDGKTTPLKYAYARLQTGFFDPKKDDTRVILSDVAIPEEALKDDFARHKMAAEGKLHGVEVVLNSEGQPVSGGLLHEAFKNAQGYVSVSGMHKFKAKKFDRKVVEGTLLTPKPDEFMNKTFEYSAEFRTTVRSK